MEVEEPQGKQVDFSNIDLDFSNRGPFHKAVLKAAQKIPYGNVVTYRDLARMANNERAARAAGTAIANNTTPLIVPCHRVLAANCKIGGFALGLEWKRTLLELEGIQI